MVCLDCPVIFMEPVEAEYQSARRQLTVSALVEKYDYKDITVAQLAEYAGFTESQKRLLDIFWDPAFNEGKLYLSDQLIREHLTNETGKNAVTNFVTRMLIACNTEGIDYWKVTKDHQLVQACGISDVVKRGGHNKYYYLVSGKCYKKLLMQGPRQKRDKALEYYLQVEHLAIIMSKYVIECATRDNKLLREKNEVLMSIVRSASPKARDEFVYIAVAPDEHIKCRTTIGTTDNPEYRLKLYNSKRSGNGLYYYAFIQACHNARMVESIVRAAFSSFLVEGTRDVFHVPYHVIRNAMIDTLATWDNVVEQSNDYLQMLKDGDFRDNPIPPSVDVPESIKHVQWLADLDQDERIEKLSSYLEQFIQRSDPGSTLTEEITIMWTEFLAYLRGELMLPIQRVMPIRRTFQRVVDNYPNIHVKWSGKSDKKTERMDSEEQACMLLRSA